MFDTNSNFFIILVHQVFVKNFIFYAGNLQKTVLNSIKRSNAATAPAGESLRLFDRSCAISKYH